ncbi:MAG: sulfur carrier protein ThiS [Spirochaetota bacterium]|nr:sulfur carrier protein ThiS [Spirochaetota bacterium]
MKIQVNGKIVEFDKSKISELLEEYNLDKMLTVVEKNGEIIKSDIYEEEELKEGDVIEIVQLVGGG